MNQGQRKWQRNLGSIFWVLIAISVVTLIVGCAYESMKEDDDSEAQVAIVGIKTSNPVTTTKNPDEIPFNMIETYDVPGSFGRWNAVQFNEEEVQVFSKKLRG